MVIKNHSGLIYSEKFLNWVSNHIGVHNKLIVFMRSMTFSEKKKSLFESSYGYYYYSRIKLRHKIIVQIDKDAKYPHLISMPIGVLSPGGKKLISEECQYPDDDMIWVLGHEIWHYKVAVSSCSICRMNCSKPVKKVICEYRANLEGFRWLKLYKKWARKHSV